MILADHRGSQRGKSGAYYIYCVSQHRESLIMVVATSPHELQAKLLMRTGLILHQLSNDTVLYYILALLRCF